MVTFEESFLYPLILLLIGAGVSGVLVAWLTNRWQDRRREREIEIENRRQKQQNDLEDLRKEREIEVERKRKELEIKVDILSKITEAYGSVQAKIVLSTQRREPISNIDEVLEKFVVDGSMVFNMLLTYYSSEADISEKWTDFFTSYVPFIDATSLYFVKDPTEDEESSLKRDLDAIKSYFTDNKEINWAALTADMPYDYELWLKINDLYGVQVADLLTDVLMLSIKVF
jgi:CRISPR/Cas system-associated endonuclease/helicase Cas3